MLDIRPWSRNHWFITLLTAFSVWLVFAWIGPGDDYIRCYTWMVNEPERLPQVAQTPWTMNPPWLAPFMAPFVSLPGRSGYIVFMAATIAIVIYACYYLGGKPIPVLLSAHIMWILWWGQIEGWGILGFLLAWIALKKRSWPMMFLALALAAFKPQVSLAPVLALWWWSGKQRWYSLAALLALFALSLWVWGPWPVWYVQGALRIAGQQRFGPWNASLGLIAAPLFIPALLLPLERDKRIIALTATALIASPYLPYYSSILLLCFPVPLWAYLFGFLAYLPSLIGTQLAWNGIVLLPIFTLVWIYWPILKSWQAWQNIIQIFQRTPRT